MTAACVAAGAASADTRLVNYSASEPAEDDIGKEERTKLDAEATEPNFDGVPRGTVSVATTTSTAAKRPGLG